MAALSAFSFGDVVPVPFPFTDQTGTERRPAVVVSSQGYNRKRRDIVILAITSQVACRSGMAKPSSKTGKVPGFSSNPQLSRSSPPLSKHWCFA